MVRRKILPSSLENEPRSSSPGTTTLICSLDKSVMLVCRALKWLWERSNNDNEPPRHTNAAHFLTTRIRSLKYQTLCQCGYESLAGISNGGLKVGGKIQMKSEVLSTRKYEN